MRGRFKKWASPFLDEHEEVVLKEINPTDSFFRHTDLRLEVGSGKGDFVIGMALKNPSANFLAIERETSIAGILAKKVVESNLNNIRVINGDFDILLPELQKLKFDVVYLNFSDPWPKKRHEKRRLTNRKRLDQFETLLKDEGELRVKTDNDSLYAYTLEEIAFSPFTMYLNEENYVFDEENDVASEYEKNFRSQGKSIHRILMRKKKK